jgi:tetratricopeptide (TPR) repeat protein
MRLVYKILLMALLLSLTTACGTLTSRGNFKDSVLSNLNPAPETMSPPTFSPDGTVDATYLQNRADYHFTMGEAKSLEYKHDRAVEEFKLALLYDPDSVYVRKRLAEEFVKLGLHTEALEQAEVVVAKAPADEDGRLLLARLYTSLRMYDEALKQYLFVTDKNPDNREAPVFIGAILAEQQKYDEAVAHYERFIANPRHVEVRANFYLYIGQIQSERGAEFADKAEAAFSEALRLKPEDAEIVTALAKVLHERGKDQKAIRLLESYQDKFGPERRVANSLSRAYLEAEEYEKAYRQLEYLEGFDQRNLNIKFRLALLLIEMKKFKSAVERLEEILSTSPELDKIRFYLGAVYEELDDHDQAIKHFSLISAASAYHTEAIVHVAHLHKQKGNYGQAIEIIKGAIEKRPDTPQFYAFYASLLDEKRDYDAAVDMLTSAVKRFPSNTQLRFFLGSMHDRRGEVEKTIENMKLVIEQDQSHVQALNYLAYTYADNNRNLPEALQLSLRALELQPDDGYILDTVGWVHYKKGQYAQALKYLEAAFQAKSDEAIIAEHLGDVYYRLQMNEKAKSMYRRAIAVEKDVDKAQKIREKLAAVDVQDRTRRPASATTVSPGSAAAPAP